MEEKKELETPVQNSETPLGSTEPETKTATPPVESPKPKMNKKVLMIVGVVLLLALAGGGYFLWQNSQKQTASPIDSPKPTAEAVDPTADWKTYTNTELSFSLKYPPSWNQLENDCQKITVSRSDAIELEMSINDYVKRQGFSDSTDLNQIIKEVPEEYQISFSNISQNNVVVLGPQGEGENNSIYIRGPEGTGYYNIVVNYNGPTPDKDKVCSGNKITEYKQILSTFKFVEDTSNWKTYTDPDYNFELKQPAGGKLDSKDTGYIRFQNYSAEGDTPGLGPNEYYLEIVIDNKSSDTNFDEGCKSYIVDPKKYTTDGIEFCRGIGQPGGDPGGIRFTIFTIYKDRAFAITATENHEDGPIANAILDSFKFIQ